VPVFEYRCQACGHVVEFLEKGRRGPKRVCPRCQSPDLKKLLSGFAVGQSAKPTSPPCLSCPGGGPCSTDGCTPGQCPMSF